MFASESAQIISPRAIRAEQSCHLPDPALHRTHPAKFFLEHVAAHLAKRPHAPTALPEGLEPDLEVNHQLIAFARHSPQCALRLTKLLAQYCLARQEVNKDLASALYKTARELPLLAKVAVLQELAGSCHFKKYRVPAGRAMSLIILSSKNNLELLTLVKESKIEEITARVPQLKPYIDFYNIRKALHAVAKPKQAVITDSMVAVTARRCELKQYVRELKIALDQIPGIRSRTMYKLYNRALSVAQKEVQHIFAGTRSKKERRERVNCFLKELDCEIRFALSLEVRASKPNVAKSKLPHWDKKYLSALAGSIKCLAEPLVVFTDKLSRIIITQNKNDDDLGSRERNGDITLNELKIKEQPLTFLYGRHSELKTLLLHEMGHSLHLRRSRLSSIEDVYGQADRLNPILQHSLWMRSMGWKIIPPEEFKVLERSRGIRLHGQEYPLELQTQYEGNDVTFQLSRYGPKSSVVYQVGGEHYHDVYGASNPTEHFVSALGTYLLKPAECLQKYPITFIYFEQQFNRYAQDTYLSEAIQVLEEKKYARETPKPWSFKLQSGLCLARECRPESDSLTINSPLLPEEIILRYGANNESELNLQSLLGETLALKLPPAVELIYIIEKVTTLASEGWLTTASNSTLKSGLISELCDRLLPHCSTQELAQCLKIQRIGRNGNIFLVTSPSPAVLAHSMMRFQETYESPEFEGEIFRRNTYADWYSKQKNDGVFTYYEDRHGFNFNERALKRIGSAKLDDLTPAESLILSTLSSAAQDNLYVIGTPLNEEHEPHPAFIDHELAHALWNTSRGYKDKIKAELEALADQLTPFKTHLLTQGYSNSKLEDECQAYLLDGASDLKARGIEVSREMRASILKMQKIFKNFKSRHILTLK
jgi:hypothetical protein